MAVPRSLRMAYFGDDFTGSTDALESLTRAGLRTALFMDPPTAAQLASRPDPLDAIGVAGHTRSLPTAELAAVLRPALTALRELGPRHVHYKVCSTFDSSPRIGSIGRAIEIGREVFAQRWVPVLIGTPALGRYVVFGQLFARFGIGRAGAIHRLDRHPALVNHPVTPMREADLRRHLSAQTALPSALIDVLALEGDARSALDAVLADDAVAIVLFDGLTPAHVHTAGSLIDEVATPPWFTVGSSAVGAALARGGGDPITFTIPAPVEPMLVVSGSCSPVTADQIAWAEHHGFCVIEVAPHAADIARLEPRMRSLLRQGDPVVVCTSRGESSDPVSAVEVGTALGALAREALQGAGIRRVVVAGGDTSSYAGRALGIESLTMRAPLAPGAPLCRAHGAKLPGSEVEIVFKGGQVGAPDFFGAVRRGHL